MVCLKQYIAPSLTAIRFPGNAIQRVFDGGRAIALVDRRGRAWQYALTPMRVPFGHDSRSNDERLVADLQFRINVDRNTLGYAILVANAAGTTYDALYLAADGTSLRTDRTGHGGCAGLTAGTWYKIAVRRAARACTSASTRRWRLRTRSRAPSRRGSLS